MAATPLSRLLARFRRNEKGVTAIEFGLVALPLLLLVFAILEISIFFFVNSSLDIAVTKTSRRIRTGEILSQGLSQQEFKASICEEMSNSFNCAAKLRLTVDVISDIAGIQGLNPLDASGNVSVTEHFDLGKGGDYVLVQAFLPWDSFTDLVTIMSRKTSGNEYMLVSTALFRNEAF